MTVVDVALAAWSILLAQGMPLKTMAEEGIGLLLLRLRHTGIECLEGRQEFLNALGMECGDLAIGLDILDCGHRLRLIGPGLDECVEALGIVQERFAPYGAPYSSYSIFGPNCSDACIRCWLRSRAG